MAQGFNDYPFFDDIGVAGRDQDWKCAGCGGTVTPGSEATIVVCRPDNGAYIPLLVHAECRGGMMRAGSWAAWEKRIQFDSDEYDLAAARKALESRAGLAEIPDEPPPPA